MITHDKFSKELFNAIQHRSPIPTEGVGDLFPIIIVCMALSIVSPSFADESLSVSGRLDLRGVYALHDDSVKEEPSLVGRIKIDTGTSAWRFHSWIEGGWDGAVKRPPRDDSLF